MLDKEMFFLVTSLGFGYAEIMAMDHCEVWRWIDMAAKHAKEKPVV
jgi:hypothetical protein